MGKLMKEIPFLEKEDTLSLAMMMLYFISKDDSYSTIGKLSLLLDQKSFINFIKYYGGKTIKVPTFHLCWNSFLYNSFHHLFIF